jgi:GGDEF domain-containing protein
MKRIGAGSSCFNRHHCTEKAENYLEYLGKHDVLTKLYNRSFFTEELNRLERSILRPVSCIFWI